MLKLLFRGLALYLALLLNLAGTMLQPAQHVLYVPVQLTTCTNCSDQIINLPPQRVGPGNKGVVEFIITQESSSKLGAIWLKEGFAGHQQHPFMTSPPVKTITAPCVCSPNDPAPTPRQKFDIMTHTLQVVPPDKISLPQLIGWYRGKATFSVVNPQQRTYVHLLPGQAPIGTPAGSVALIPAGSNNSASSSGAGTAGTSRTGASGSGGDTNQRRVVTCSYPAVATKSAPAPATGIVDNSTKKLPKVEMRSVFLPTRDIPYYDDETFYARLEIMNAGARAYHIQHRQAQAQKPPEQRSFTLASMPSYESLKPSLPIQCTLQCGNNIQTSGPSDAPMFCSFSIQETSFKERLADQRKEREYRQDLIDKINKIEFNTWLDKSETYTPQMFFNEVVLQAYLDGEPYLTTDIFFGRIDLYQYDAYINLLGTFPDCPTKIRMIKKIIDENPKKYTGGDVKRYYHIIQDNTAKTVSLQELLARMVQHIERQETEIAQKVQAAVNEHFERELRAIYTARYNAALLQLKQEHAHELNAVHQEQRKLIAAQAKRTSDYEDYGNTRRVKINDAASYSKIFNKKSDDENFQLCFPVVDNEPLDADACDDTLQHFIDLAEANPNDPWHQQDAGAVQTMVAYFHEALETDPEQARRWEHRINALTKNHDAVPIERLLIQATDAPGKHNLDEAIKNKNTSCNAIRDSQYSTEFKNFLEQKGFSLGWGHFYSHPVDWETGQIMRTMYETEQRYGNFYDVQHLHECTVWALEVARDRNSTEPRRNLTSYHFLDMAHAFAKAARTMGELLIQAEDHEIYSGEAVQQLFGRTAQILGQHTKEIIKHPKPLLKEAAYLICLPLVFNIGRLVHAAYCDRDKIVKFFTHHQEFVAKNNELFIKDPQEAINQMMTSIIEFAITGIVLEKGGKLSAHTQKWCKFSGKEKFISTTAKTSGIHNPTQTPLTNLANKAVEELKQIAQQGAENLKGALQTATAKAKHYLNIPAAKNATTSAQKIDAVMQEFEAAKNLSMQSTTVGNYTSEVVLTHKEFIEVAEKFVPKNHPNRAPATKWRKPGAPINGQEIIKTSIDPLSKKTITTATRYRYPRKKNATGHSLVEGNLEEVIEIIGVGGNEPIIHKANLHIRIIEE